MYLFSTLTPYQSINPTRISARHDGDGNSCRAEDQYIMRDIGGRPTQDTILNPWLFSACSVDYFRFHINTHISTRYDHGHLLALPIRAPESQAHTHTHIQTYTNTHI